MNTKNKLADMPVRPLLYTMAIPLMLSLLVQSLYNIVDSMFVARLSETALTAASLVYSIQFLMIAVGVGTAVGLNALLSRKIGQHKPEEACRAATTGLCLMLVTSLVFSLAGVFFSDVIAAKLTPEPDLQELCRQYLSINLVYCWGIFLQTYAQRLLQAVGDTILSMISLIIGAILNIILDPIMIFGFFGCSALQSLCFNYIESKKFCKEKLAFFVCFVVFTTILHPFNCHILLIISPLNFKYNRSCSVITADNHNTLILCPSLHNRSALKSCVYITGNRIPCFGTEWHFRTACYGIGITSRFYQCIESQVPVIIPSIIPQKNKFISHIITRTGS